MHDQCWYVPLAFGNRRVNAVTAKDMHNRFTGCSTRQGRAKNRMLTVLPPQMKNENSNPYRELRRCKMGFKVNYLTDNKFATIIRALHEIER